MPMVIPGAVIGLAACAPHTPHVADSPTPMFVTASSIQSSYGIQFHVAGSSYVRDNWLYVTLPTGAIRTYQGTAPAWDLLMRAALVSCTGDRHERVVSVSQPAHLATIVGFTQDSSMLDTTSRAFRDTVRLDLGVPATVDPAHSWIEFELTWPVSNVLATYRTPANVTLAQTGGAGHCGGGQYR